MGLFRVGEDSSFPIPESFEINSAMVDCFSIFTVLSYFYDNKDVHRDM